MSSEGLPAGKNTQVEVNPLTVEVRNSEDMPDEGVDVLHVDDPSEFVEVIATCLWIFETVE